MKKSIYITHAKRTPVGSFLGSLSSIPSQQLGSMVIRRLLEESKLDPASINEVLMGQVLTGGAGQNPARQSLIASGIPKEVTATTINQVCGSGLKAVAFAAQSILTGDNELVIAGGQENMSLGMHAAYVRSAKKFGDVKLTDLILHDGLMDAFSGHLMGVTAENISKQFSVSREMQDEFSLNSQKKATIADKEGWFKSEIIGVEISSKKQNIIFDRDESIRADSNMELLSKLKPAFDPNGTVTAGNSSTINDGAAACIIASEAAVIKHSLTPIARIVSYAEAGVDPSIMGTGPVPASKKALAKAGWSAESLDLIESNEAFAAQACYVNQQMKWDTSKVNICGGAIAIGHPIGASGARVLVTLIHQMQRIKANKGLVTLCIGGGMGISACIERV